LVVSESEFHELEEKMESLEETVEVLGDKKILASIRRSLDEIKSGRYKDYATAKEFRNAFEARP
jgi:hypothetical protein